MEIFANFPLWAALIAIVFAQFIKIPIKLIVARELSFRIAFSTGGMPSSHSAAVTSLTTAVGIVEGVTSTIFAVACVFSVITMYDASGIRRHAGKHAVVLNQLMNDLQTIFEDVRDWNKKEDKERREDLKELLGHEPIEVFFGAITGIIVAFVVHPWFI
ncbi:divergent PAP2 family protein [Oceanobacillus alkalisoli]|uniref:divergent PAP2 family protein n=1 Tax=Oceanobacillus alkalisoli TaxID=2925113 RepID=UPI001EEFFFFC|nr:divergent PAP2 family protein [Oceanobacillus alkalisoli]MCF3943463.1 divergent PAP2 family protein [Oceanobacillus alkalisoli]MCG5104052.1 divergent PAP2 family protein [Oceanobacillus alkalisoli]